MMIRKWWKKRSGIDKVLVSLTVLVLLEVLLYISLGVFATFFMKVFGIRDPYFPIGEWIWLSMLIFATLALIALIAVIRILIWVGEH
jgi:hypothetical protein